MAAGFDAYAPVGSEEFEGTSKKVKMQYSGRADRDPAMADQSMQQQKQPRRASNSGGGGITQSIHAATEASASALSVAALIIWTLAVTAWTAFQVVLNALWYREIRALNLGGTMVPGQVGTQFQASGTLEEKALWGIMGIEAGIALVFLGLSVGLMWVPYIRSCRGGTRSRRTKRSFLVWVCTLVLICSAWFKVFVMSSLVNKMQAQGAWCASGENLDLQYTFTPGAQAPEAPGCTPAPFAPAIRMTLVFALLTIGFHMIMYFLHQPRGILGKLFGLVPAVLTVGALLVKPITSIMNWYYTQGHFTQLHNYTFTAEVIVALISFITAVWLSLYMGWAMHSVRLIPRFTNTLLACCGRKHVDVYYESEEQTLDDDIDSGHMSYSLRAAIKSMVQQFYYMVQLPSVFGFVAPMITYFSLGVQNWWIVADILSGAAILIIYMLMCAFHRRLLAPSKR